MAKATSEYTRKRNFSITSEPAEDSERTDEQSRGKSTANALHFVVQKHDARRLHYDFRLELEGTLKSWAVPKGPSLDPSEKRLAVHVEDHPLAYAGFEGSIPAGQYGGGDVIVWDEGRWFPEGDPAKDYQAGKLKFTLAGKKLVGRWNLVRTHMRHSGNKEQWLLIKERDEEARDHADYDITEAQPTSVLSGASVGEKRSASKKKSKTSTSKNTAAKPAASKKIPEQSAAPKAPKKTPAAITKSAKSAKLPALVKPELATLVSDPPDGDWLYEVKYDGYRILTRIQDGAVRFFSRNGKDWTDRLPRQAEAIAQLKLRDSWLDGEVVVLNNKELPDFQALQNAFDANNDSDIIYYLFDAPFLNGKDLRELPVEDRRAALEQLLEKASDAVLRFSGAFSEAPQHLLNSACDMGLEGVIGKRLGSLYSESRSRDWIKLKCRRRQEFVIIGFTEPQGSRQFFGALLLGVYEADRLVYCGRVGTGFNENSLKQLHKRMQKLTRKTSPLAEALTGQERRGVQWLKPQLVGEVEFAEWTGEGRLRQASFLSLRSDKPAQQIIREQPTMSGALPGSDSGTQAPATKSTRKKNQKSPSLVAEKAANRSTKTANVDAPIAGVKITHPDRIIDPASGASKFALAACYESMAEWILPALKNRPVSLLRLPSGLGGEQFFQKHAERGSIPQLTQLDKKLDPAHAPLMQIDSLAGLAGAVQMGTIELHTWGSTSDKIEQPDRIILDLDPDPQLSWKHMLDATQLTLALLDELKLDAFLKTSGGKGIHIVIPLARRSSWDEVKQFAKAIAEFMAYQIPDRFVAKMGPKNRVGKIFIDYLRNQRGASTVCAYSVRAREGLPISTPIHRDELKSLKGAAQWHIGNIAERLKSLKDDPWQGYANRQRITQAQLKKLQTKG